MARNLKNALGAALLALAFVAGPLPCHGRALRGESAPPPVVADTAVMPQSADTGLVDYWDMLKRVVVDYCFLESNSNCDVDFDFNTTWASGAFPTLAVMQGVNAMPSLGPLKIDQGSATATKRTISTNRCPYNPQSTQMCRMDQQTINTSTITTTHMAAWSFQGKVGGVLKAATNVGEMSYEASVDFGYSFSDAQVSATMAGETTVSSVQVLMDPSDPTCTIITLYVNQVQERGVVSVYVDAVGFVATKQAAGVATKQAAGVITKQAAGMATNQAAGVVINEREEWPTNHFICFDDNVCGLFCDMGIECTPLCMPNIGCGNCTSICLPNLECGTLCLFPWVHSAGVSTKQAAGMSTNQAAGVATNQAASSPQRPDIDPQYTYATNGGATRAIWLPYLVQVAQAKNLPSAAPFQVLTDEAGNPMAVRLAVPVNVTLQVAINGYAEPQKYPANSTQCM